MSELSRAQQAPGAAFDDPSIPVLTDRIYLPAVDLDIALPANSATPAAPAPELAGAQPAAPEPALVLDADFDADLAAVLEFDEAQGVDTAGELLPEAAHPPEAVEAALAPGADVIDARPDATDGEPAPAEGAMELQPPAPAGEAATGSEMRPQPAAEPPSPAAAAVAAADELAAQAESLRASLLQAVAERLPGHLESAVRELMQPAISEAVARLGEEAQVALRITLQDLVEQALREELARRNPGNTPD